MLLPLFYTPFPAWAQISTNLNALPGSAPSAETQQPAPQGENAPPPKDNFGASAGVPTDGIVSQDQAQKAADNLGIEGANNGFQQNTPQQNNPQNQGENSPPAPAQPQEESPSADSAPDPSAAPTPYENSMSPVSRSGTTLVPPIPASPPPLILAPPFPAVALHPPVDPEPVEPVNGAISDTRPLANSLDGLRVEFAPLKDDMDQETIEAITRFGKQMAENPKKRLMMEGFSGAQDDDPSLPRRLALQRLLKIRSILMHSGVASTRIYPNTIGIPHPNTHETNGPSDRVDIYPEENPNEIIPADDALARAQKAYGPPPTVPEPAQPQAASN
ncbi:hypothetical protein FAI40_02005 [Acetobacteraceae bacterium]|nr:hypothetical protein FAI40_02005 [Acetobacteraceae bacterium]